MQGLLRGGRRLGEGFAAAFLTLLGVFLLVRLLPGDPADIRLAASGVLADPATLAALRADLALDLPLWSQFLAWLGGLATLDAGRSLANDRAVLGEIGARLPWSLAVGLAGLGLGVAAGVALGFRAALRPVGPSAAASRALSILAQALPAFAVALLAFWLLAVEWRLVRPVSGSAAERVLGPILVVALFAAGAFARITFATLQEVRRAPWFTTALARGRRPGAALGAHGGPAVALAVLAALVPELGWAIGGTAVAEIVFGLPGLSAFVTEAAAARDHSVLQLYLVAVLAWIACAHAAVEVARRWLDPRPRPPA
jgi:peptide/nickel transport system permease protein